MVVVVVACTVSSNKGWILCTFASGFIMREFSGQLWNKVNILLYLNVSSELCVAFYVTIFLSPHSVSFVTRKV